MKSRRLRGRLSSGVHPARAARRSLALLVAAPAQAGTLYSVPAAGGTPTIIVREAGTVFGPLCRRADGAFEAFTETRSGRARLGTFAAGSKPRWRRAPRELIAAHYSPACERVVEVYYSFGALHPPGGSAR